MRFIATACAASIICFSVPSLAVADKKVTVPRVAIDIPAQNLESALQVLSKQHDFQVIYRSEVVGQLRTNGAVGVFTPLEALRELLNGTGLTFRHLNDNTVTIVPASDSSDGTSSAQVESGASKRSANNSAQTLRLASARQAPDEQSIAQKASSADSQQANDSSATHSQELIVTGSRLNRAESEGAQPVVVLSREAIAASGQRSVVDFLRTLPEVSGSGHNETGFGSYPHAQTVQLRGLPAGRTLILVNGRRVAANGNVDGGFANLNSVPPEFIERIDLLPLGASAVYGSDALAGVINIILRRDIDGLHLGGRYGATSGASDKAASAVWGVATDKASISLAANWQEAEALRTSDRDHFNNVDFTRFGWRDLRGFTCRPGTVYAVSGTLNGLGTESAAIPAGLSGAPTIADFVPTAGQVNACFTGIEFLSFPSKRWNLLGRSDWQISERTTLFVDVTYSHLEHSFSMPWVLNNRIVPASNPFNPFGQDVRVNYRFSDEYMPPLTSEFKTNSSRVVAALQGDWSNGWGWEISGWSARDHSTGVIPLQNTGYQLPALSSTDPATALNPFTSGAPASPAVLQAILDDPAAYSSAPPRSGHNTLRGGNLVLRGDLLRLPAGPLSAALGTEYSEEDYHNIGSNRGDFDAARDAFALFAELRAPLLARNGADLLVVSAAARHDDYSDFGESNTSQFGLELRPANGWLFRAAHGESFRAPDLFAVYGPSVTAATTATIIDRQRNETYALQGYTAGGNLQLRPETGESTSLGFVWSGERARGLTVSGTVWRMKMTERISNFPSRQLIVDNEELFSHRVVREPAVDGVPGRIVSVDYSALNLGTLWVEGVDISAEYRIRSRLGTFTPSVRATRYTRYDALLDPSVGMADYLAKANTDLWVPKLRATLGLNWRGGSWSAGVLGRYVGHYRDYNPLTDGTYQQLGSFFVWDANVRWDAGGEGLFGRRWLAGSYLALSVVDLFDHDPRFAATTSPGYGYDGAQDNIRGRYGSLSIGVKF